MSANSKIEWCDTSWQTISGCSKISPGCANCYASKMTRRLQAMGQKKYAAGFDKVVCHEDALSEPFAWKKPRRIFVNSMADTFHKDVRNDFIHRLFAVAAVLRQHTFLFLTKRPERMFVYMTRDDIEDAISSALGDMLDGPWIHTFGKPFREMIEHQVCNFLGEQDEDDAFQNDAEPWPLKNVWLGVTVESQDQLDRIEWLKKTPAAVRFVSFEPLLGHVLPSLKGLDLIIVGAETGPGARHMNLEWAIALRELCKMAHIPFFFKKPSKGDVLPKSLDLHEFPKAK